MLAVITLLCYPVCIRSLNAILRNYGWNQWMKQPNRGKLNYAVVKVAVTDFLQKLQIWTYEHMKHLKKISAGIRFLHGICRDILSAVLGYSSTANAIEHGVDLQTKSFNAFCRNYHSKMKYNVSTGHLYYPYIFIYCVYYAYLCISFLSALWIFLPH